MSIGGQRGADPIGRSGRWGVMDVFSGLPFLPISAVGGDEIFDEIVQDVLYRFHVFTTVGSSQAFEVLSLGDSNGLVNLAVVGGGGGGGNIDLRYGGGGAGGVAHNFGVLGFPVTVGSVSVTVGAGGVGQNDGQSSLFGSILARGGGQGGLASSGANDGGSGGGGGSQTVRGFATQPNTNSSPFLDLGNDGGVDGSAGGGGNQAGAGGGGAVSAGTASSVGGPCGDGGNGVDLSVFVTTSLGENGFFAGGGGGSGANIPRRAGIGGVGGGGDGARGTSTSDFAENGIPGTGGGAGGAPWSGAGYQSTVGGSGIVIVRYPLVPV